MFVFSDKPSIGPFYTSIVYELRVQSGGGTIVDKERPINVYHEILTLGLRDDPSLLCTCDSYLANPLLGNGKLYTIIPE